MMSSLAQTKTSPWTEPFKWRLLGVEQETADDALVERASQGDVSAYQELVLRYEEKAHAVAMGVLGNYDDAEDVVQEAFLKVFKNLSSFRRQSSFYTWLYRITFNLAIDSKRKRYRSAEMSSGDHAALERGAQEEQPGTDLLLSRTPRPDETLERGRLRTKIRQAIETLSPEHRAVILLREVEGLSYAEIGEAVGCAKGTVMSRLHHARRRLQEALRDTQQAESDSDNRYASESSR